MWFLIGIAVFVVAFFVLRRLLASATRVPPPGSEDEEEMAGLITANFDRLDDHR